MLKQKVKRLERILHKMGSILLAYSGGVDSTFLLKIASQVLPNDKLLAVTANSPTYPKEELLFSKSVCRKLVVRQRIIKTNEFKDRNFVSNPQNRCYFCKKELFCKLKTIAKQYGLNQVVDASNISDKRDYRPGSIAKKELKIRSPLAEAGFTKEDIRKMSKAMRLSTWDKPSLACLASRIPYGIRITTKTLGRINAAERIIRRLGFSQVRVRHYDGLCRIEVPKSDIHRLLTRSQQIVDNLRKLGYNFITVDLQGYRTGSLNEVIK